MRLDLVERAQRGDHDAFTRLVDLGGDGCYRIAYRILRDADRAQDAVQQAYIRVWRDLPRLRDPERYDAWVYRIVVNAAYGEARRQRRVRTDVRTIGADGHDRDDLAGALDDRLAAVDQRDAIERAFRALSPEHRAVVVLHHYVGLPVETVAEIVGVPTGTVKSRLFYATRALRGVLASEAPAMSSDPRPA